MKPAEYPRDNRKIKTRK